MAPKPKNTESTTPAETPAPDLHALLVDKLGGAEVKWSPSGAKARYIVDGTTVAYVTKQTARGIRVELLNPTGRAWPGKIVAATDEKTVGKAAQAVMNAAAKRASNAEKRA